MVVRAGTVIAQPTVAPGARVVGRRTADRARKVIGRLVIARIAPRMADRGAREASRSTVHGARVIGRHLTVRGAKGVSSSTARDGMIGRLSIARGGMIDPLSIVRGGMIGLRARIGRKARIGRGKTDRHVIARP